MPRPKRKYLYILGALILVLYVLPNTVNFSERRAFADGPRIKEARHLSPGATDSISVIPGQYYERGDFYKYFFGEKHRQLWLTPVKVPVFNYGHVLGGLVPYELGGSQQTISIRLKDSAGRHWVLRSVNKDQKNVLPGILQPSLFRSVFRDQVSSMNPYGPKVVAMLSGVLQLPHVSPSLYWMPYDETHGKYNERMAGRLVYLEEHTDSTWRFTPQFMNATQIIETDELEALGKEKIPIDTLLYLKTRLFDMLVNDWDRHQDQWKWALVEVNGQRILRPIARDRDIAFYVFDEGIINRLAVGFNDKFQSFRPEFDNIKGLMKQSKKMDRQYLSGLPQSAFVSMATSIQAQLSSEQIAAAFQHYPPVIYKKYGRTHEAILAERLKRLTAAAAEFHKLVNKD